MMMIFAFEQSLDYCGLSWDLSAGFLQLLSDQTSRLPSTIIRPNLQTSLDHPTQPPDFLQPLSDQTSRLPSTIIRPNLQASLNHYPTKPPGFPLPLSDQTSRLPSTIRPNLQASFNHYRTKPPGFPQPLSDQTSRLPSTIIQPNLQASFNHYPTKPPGFLQPSDPTSRLPQPLSDLLAGFPQLSNQTYLETFLQTSLYYPTKPTLRPPCRLPSTIQPNHPCPIVPLYLKILS